MKLLLNVKEAGCVSVAVREPSILTVTGIATRALVFWLFMMVFLSHSSHVKTMVEALEKQNDIEDLSTGLPVMIPYVSALTPSSLKRLTTSSESLMLCGLRKAIIPADNFDFSVLGGGKTCQVTLSFL